MKYTALFYIALLLPQSAVYALQHQEDSMLEIAKAIDFTGSIETGETTIYFKKSDVVEDSGIASTLLSVNGEKIMAIAASDNNAYFADASTRARLWDFHQKILLRDFSVGKNYINTLAFSPDSKLIASGDKDGIIAITSIDKGELLSKIYAHKGGVSKIAFSPDGQLLLSGGLDRKILLWNTKNWNAIKTFLFPKAIKNISISPDNKNLAVCLSDGKLQIIRIESGDVIREYSGDETTKRQDKITHAIYSPSGKYFITISIENNYMLWDAETNKIQRRTVLKDICVNSTVRFCPDEKRYVSTFFDPTYTEGYIRSWDMRTNELLVNLHLNNNYKRFYTNVLLSKDMKNLFAVFSDIENQNSDAVVYTIAMSDLLCGRE